MCCALRCVRFSIWPISLPSVSVDEAVEIAKQYSTDESGKFVNGILGAFLRGEGKKSEE